MAIWDKWNWKDVAIPLIALIAGGIGAFVANSFTYLNTQRELDIAMVKISLSILAGENKQEKTEPARRFALRALDKYSGIDIEGDGMEGSEFERWVKDGEVQFGDAPTLHAVGDIVRSSDGSADYFGDWGSNDYFGAWGVIPLKLGRPESANAEPRESTDEKPQAGEDE